MTAPSLAKTKTTTQHVIAHEIKHRTPDYIDIVTIILPAVTFIAGYFLNNLVEKQKEKKRLRRVKAYFFTLATTLETAMRRQAGAFRDAGQRIEELVGNNFAVSMVSSLRTERIRAIPDMDLFTLFVGPNSEVIKTTNQLNSIADTVDFIDSVKFRVGEVNTDTFERISSMQKSYGEDIDKLKNLVDTIKLQKVGPIPIYFEDVELIILIEKHLNAYYSERKEFDDIPTLYDTIVKPIYEGSRNIKFNPENTNMLNLINKLNSDYVVIVSYKRGVSIEYNQIAAQLDSARTELIRAVQALH